MNGNKVPEVRINAIRRKITKDIGRRKEVLFKFFINLNGNEIYSAQQGDYEIPSVFLSKMESTLNGIVLALKKTDGIKVIVEKAFD